MSNAVLLSPSDVVVIRRYVQTKYAPLPKARQAEIVAEAVRGTIERRLPDLNSKLKSRITQELIHRCLVGESRDVIPEDVLDVCSDLAFEEPMDLERLTAWLEEREQGRWSREQIASRVNRGNRQPGTLPPGHEIGSESNSAAAVAAVPAAEPLSNLTVESDAERYEAETANGYLKRYWRKNAIWLGLTFALAIGMTMWALPGPNRSGESDRIDSAQPGTSSTAVAEANSGGMPDELRYMEFESKDVLAYLHSRDSLLAEEPYFSAIVASAKEYDVNPLLLLAITGQEQGFVPKTNKQAEQIANNPFNVFHSWQDYNTDIRDSSRIAAKLIAKLGRQIPEGEEAISWMNRTYAEDPGWSKGVRQLFDKLTELSS